MNYLVLSIFFSVSVSVLLKLSRRHHIDIEQAVAVNYLAAIVLCLMLLKPPLGNWNAYLPTWWIYIALGVLLPSVFVILGRAVEVVGIVKTDAVQRLSLFLPIVASFLIFGESLSVSRVVGIILAFGALLCLLYKHEATGTKKGVGGSHVVLLLGVWAGYGVIDILFKQIAKSGVLFSTNMLIAFSLAAILMFAYHCYQHSKWRGSAIFVGILLGGLNFANIWSYIRTHQVMSSNPTLVFSGVNIGVIVTATLVGALIFKEKISPINAMGIVIAIIAIACLFYWPFVTHLFS